MASRTRTASAASPAESASAKSAPVAAPCGCGCGTLARPGRSFVQGHDARFHGILARALASGETSVEVGGRTVEIAAEYAARGWKPAQPRKSRKLSPEDRVARLREQLAKAEAELV